MSYHCTGFCTHIGANHDRTFHRGQRQNQTWWGDFTTCLDSRTRMYISHSPFTSPSRILISLYTNHLPATFFLLWFNFQWDLKGRWKPSTSIPRLIHHCDRKPTSSPFPTYSALDQHLSSTSSFYCTFSLLFSLGLTSLDGSAHWQTPEGGFSVCTPWCVLVVDRGEMQWLCREMEL